MAGAKPCSRELLDQARAGDRQSQEELAHLVQQRIYGYLHRATLDEHRALDLAQDTVLAVLRSLSACRDAERFWPWVFRIATNQLRQWYRYQMRHPAVRLSPVDEEGLSCGISEGEEGWVAMSRNELVEITRHAMQELSQRHREVLALRVYEDMPYVDVARVMGCSELTARVLFVRAKGALQRQLRRRGVESAALAGALLVFGRCTSFAEAAVSVNGAALGESTLTTLLPLKFKLAAGLAAAGAVAGFTAFNGDPLPGIPPPTVTRSAPFVPPPVQDPVWPGARYVHFQARSHFLTITSAQVELCETWLCFPEGFDGPVLAVRQPLAEEHRTKGASFITGPDANYRFDSAARLVHIDNARLACNMQHTEVLPTDPEGLSGVVHRHEGEASHCFSDKQGFRFFRDATTGFVTAGLDARDPGREESFQVEYDPERPADLFEVRLPEGWAWADHRDTMHKRGWTYFRLTGRAGGETLSGVGRIPLHYLASRTHPMWLRITLGSRTAVVADHGRMAIFPAAQQQVVRVLAAGLRLPGWPRPWEGFHTVDSIRRDAARQGLSYELEFLAEDRAAVLVRNPVAEKDDREGFRTGLSARYVLHMEQDLLEEIRIQRGHESTPLAELRFAYLQDIDEQDSEFVRPEMPSVSSATDVQPPGMFWPLMLDGAADHLESGEKDNVANQPPISRILRIKNQCYPCYPWSNLAQGDPS